MCVFSTGVRVGLVPPGVTPAAMTSGLVQQYDHAVLPSVTPVVTLACTVTSMLVCFLKKQFMSYYTWVTKDDLVKLGAIWLRS